MEGRKTLAQFLEQTMTIFGITVTVLIPLTAFFGNSSKDLSSVFCLGSDGVPVLTLLQFLLNSVCINLQRLLFLTDSIIKRGSVAARTALLVLGITLQVGFFAYLFHWFPINHPLSWLSYFTCFIICFALSAALSVHKEKLENQKLEKGLRNLKEEHLDGNA